MERTLAGMAGALALVVVVSGCAEQGGGPSAAVPSPAEGARITQQWVEHIRARDADGQLVSEQQREQARRATVVGGLARTEDRQLLATVFAGAEPVRELAYHDSASGRDLRIVLERSGDGPVTRIRTFIDGTLKTDVGRRWDARGDLWILAAERTTITAPSGGSLTVDGRAASEVIEQASLPARAGFELRELAERALMPARLEAETACWALYREYIIATLALAVASEAVIGNVYNPVAYFAWTMAFDKWRATYDRLMSCLYDSGGRVF